MSVERGLPHFKDRRGNDQPFGFRSDRSGSSYPGMTWETGNMFYNVAGFQPNCDMDKAIVTDPVWTGKLRVYEKPEHAVLAEIFYSDPVRRLQAVEQLTLTPEYTTIPNTGAFSRFEHIWGSVLFVRQMAEKAGISEKDSLIMQIRTLVSDIAHTFGSHLGDWAFQGVGGAENQHDLELNAYLEATGINDILRKYNIDPNDVIFPEINDWIEASQPDLCVDRVDYGLREMNRWNDVVRVCGFNAEDFTLTPEGMLAMEDPQRARIFAEGFLLLSQEHWSEPTHRLMLDLLLVRTKMFYAEGRTPGSWVFTEDNDSLVPLNEIHPRDLMYATDVTQTDAYSLPNLGGYTLESIMKSIAMYRRQYVWPGRRQRIARYMAQFVEEDSYVKIQQTGQYTPIDSEEFHSYEQEYPPTHPLGFAILDAEEAAATASPYAIDIPQPSFKTRQIDPLVKVGDGFKQLSEIDPSFAMRLAEHKEAMKKERVARIVIPDPKTHKAVADIMNNVETAWHERLESTRRMTPVELRNFVKVSSSEIFGAYPFMSFINLD